MKSSRLFLLVIGVGLLLSCSNSKGLQQDISDDLLEENILENDTLDDPSDEDDRFYMEPDSLMPIDTLKEDSSKIYRS